MFRPNVKLVLEPGAGARIVDELSHRTLSLTPTEGQLLALLGPSSTPESLAAAAKGAGLQVEPQQVEALLSRLKANELLDFTPSAPAARARSLLPDDVVPAFRPDLAVAAAPKAGLLLVSDKVNNRSFTLYDFEVHIARLLDGRHSVAEVIELASKIGIPMTPDSLGKFIGQMRAYGFISDAPVPAPAAEDKTWPARSQWSPEIRELYQSALRQFRLGRPGHALEYLDALLEVQPDTPEAIELKARVEAHLDAGPVSEVSFEDLHGAEEPLPALVPVAEPLLPTAAFPAATSMPRGTSSSPATPVMNRAPATAAPASVPAATSARAITDPEPLQIAVQPRRSAPSPLPSLGHGGPTPSPPSPAWLTTPEPAGAAPASRGPAASALSAPSPSATQSGAAMPTAAPPSSPILGAAAVRASSPRPMPPTPSAPGSSPPRPATAHSAPAAPEPRASAPRAEQATLVAPPTATAPSLRPTGSEPAPRATAPTAPPAPSTPRPRATSPSAPVPVAASGASTDAKPSSPDPKPWPAELFAQAPKTEVIPLTQVAATARPRPSPPAVAPAARTTSSAGVPQAGVPRDAVPREAVPRDVVPRTAAPQDAAPTAATALDLPAVSEAKPRRSAPRATTLEVPTVAPSPLSSGPTELLAPQPTSDSEQSGQAPDGNEPMPERTVITAPPNRPNPPRRSRPPTVSSSASPAAQTPPPAASDLAPTATGASADVSASDKTVIGSMQPVASPSVGAQTAPPATEGAALGSVPPRRSGSIRAQALPAEPPPNRLGWALGLGGGLLLAALLVPIPAVQRIEVELVTTLKATPQFPAGAFGELKVQSGSRVDEGAVLATIDVSKQKAEREELEKTVAQWELAAQKAIARHNPAALQKAKLVLARSQQDLAKARATAARLKDKPAGAKAEAEVTRRESAVTRAERALTQVDGLERARGLKIQATEGQKRLAELKQQIEHAFLAAPTSGVFQLDALPPAGAVFEGGAAFGRILDSALLLKGAPPDARDPVLLVGERRVALLMVDKRQEGLTVPFEGEVRPGRAVLEVSRGYRPWPMALLLR